MARKTKKTDEMNENKSPEQEASPISAEENQEYENLKNDLLESLNETEEETSTDEDNSSNINSDENTSSEESKDETNNNENEEETTLSDEEYEKLKNELLAEYESEENE